MDCHRVAEEQILIHLTALGLLKGDINAMAEAGMGAVFFPHGLGHLIGCDTHDVGGYMEGTPTRASRAGLKNLRTARVLQGSSKIQRRKPTACTSLLDSLGLRGPRDTSSQFPLPYDPSLS